MRRYQWMRFYVASVVLLIVGVIAGVAWLRRPRAVARAGANVPPVPASTMRPVDDAAPAPARATKAVNVAIDNFTFTPRELSVAVGTTVTWANRDDVPHTATSSDDPAAFDSRALDTDDKYSFTFIRPGTYRYYCKVHTHMTGTVIVK